MRYLAESVEEDLPDRMVFIGGPRQVGKTTFALSLLGDGANEASPAYLSWDALADREAILAERIPADQPRLVLDEIHKFARWRNLVKGLFDKHRRAVSFIVTGSARLDFYRKGGDSLQGRYHYYRLHPFTAMECNPAPDRAIIEQLLVFGGFPEPLFRAQERFHRRWMREQSARVVHEDIRDLERVREVSLLDLLLRHLPSCVGSPLSLNSLSKLLQVSHASIDHWLKISSASMSVIASRLTAREAFAPYARSRSCTSGIGRAWRLRARASRTWWPAIC